MRLLILLFILYVLSVELEAGCDPRLPNCRSDSGLGQQQKCNPFYLIPGKANECSKFIFYVWTFR